MRIDQSADGTRYTSIRENNRGIVATRGKRELYLLGTSVEQTRRSRQLLAEHSFDYLFKRGKRHPLMPNVASYKLGE